MPWLRYDARVLSITASASRRGVQIESLDGADAALHHLRFPRIHQERNYGSAPEASLHSAAVLVGLAGLNYFLLDLSQHALVSVRVLNSLPLFKCQKRDRQGGPR